MKDGNIRKILISSIKVKYPEIRIYQEKAIGGSVCDIMAVTDRLIGYEIKSDQDNYSRIESQVKWYDLFFDFNYIVVGQKHADSAINKVPEYWGIIEITEDRIVELRKPSKNKFVSTDRQLSILWKLELKNLLNYFKLPMFALKSKDFISSRLVESVPDEELKAQIVYELMHRDYSVYGAEDYSEYYKNDTADEFDTRLIELIDCVSEMNMEQMTLDEWIEIYSKARQISSVKEEKKPVSIRKAHEITYENIEVSPGVPWIGPKIIEEFVYYLKYENDGGKSPVNYEPITGNWFIEGKSAGDQLPRCYNEYGIKRYNALYILEATLNLREIKLYKDSTIYDEENTTAALEKQKDILNLFKEWVWSDEDRKWEIEEAYNNLFGKYKKEKYDGSKLEFPNMKESYSLYDYQKDAVQRIISTPNTLLAFDVGAGKTYIMITAAMLLRQRGIARKNMFVVPNNIVGQWEKIFTDLYPKAKLLVIEPKNFKRPVRDKAMQQMKYGDYDGIIIAYSCFEMIPISSDYMTTELHSKLTVLDEEIRDVEWESGSRAALENLKKSIIKTTKDMLKSMDCSSTAITFDDLEINTLFLDEAHNYKNLPIRTKLRNIRGINTQGSSKCMGMLQKVRYVQNTNGGRGVVFATGTPLCNSIADAYAMQMYLQHDDMVSTRLEVFDNWIKTFARPEVVTEIDVDTQNFRAVNRLAQFFNLTELSKMFSQIAIFHAMDKEDGIPDFEEYSDCIIPENDDLKEYMLLLAERAERIHMKEVTPSFDNMLKVSTDGRKAALDLRLVEQEQSEQFSKVSLCAKKVKEIYDSFEKCSQLVFCDYSTPKSDEFNVYADIKEKLVSMGIPEKEIAFVHSYHTEERKLALYEKVNKGEVRVLIGSTFKLGIGANVQTKLKAIHHLDVPWRPADMVQREGRILRRGNTNKNVMIFRYICEGSFDAYSWQILETKQRFISQFLEGSAYQRSSSDLEENILNYAEVKALALADPRMKTLAEMENKLGNLHILSNKFAESITGLKDDEQRLTTEIQALEVQISGSVENQKYLKNRTETEYKSIRKELVNLLTAEKLNAKAQMIGNVWGFDISTPAVLTAGKMKFIVSKNGARYSIESSDSAMGNARKVTNFFQGLPEYIDKLNKSLDEKKAVLLKVKDEMNKLNPYVDEIRELEASISRLRYEIGVIDEWSFE